MSNYYEMLSFTFSNKPIAIKEMPITEILPDGLIVALFLFVIVSSIFGNVFIVVSFAVSDHTKSVTNVFIVSLSISNMITGCCLPIFAWIQTLHPGKTYGLACELPVFIELACVAATIFGHLAVGVDRYLAVVKPASKFLTLRKAVYMVVVIWVASILYSLRLILQFSQSKIIEKQLCNLFVEEKEENLVFRVLDFVFLFILPMCALCYMYQQIGQRLRERTGEVSQIVKRKQQVVKFLAVSLASFFLSWCPFYILDIVSDAFQKTMPPDDKHEIVDNKVYVILRFCFVLMALSNCFITPFMYIIFFPRTRAKTTACMLDACKVNFRGHTKDTKVLGHTKDTNVVEHTTPDPAVAPRPGLHKQETVENLE